MSMKVLIADHDWHFAGQTRKYLESHAHLVVHESRPIHAQAKAEHWQPDLVIVSAEAAETGLLESLYEINPRPAVLITEHMDQFGRAWRAWQMGGDELLMKPVFKVEELHQAIVKALENAAAGIRRALPAAAASA